jgi:nitroreductase
MSHRSEYFELIRGRRTIHNFETELAPVELVEEAIELARWAPNHHHTEPWHFFLLGPNAISQIVDLNARLVAEKKGDEAGEAKRKRWSTIPGWLVVTCDRSADSVRQEEDYAACCCAVQNFSLAMWAHGVGVKWTTGAVTRHPELFELLEVDSEQQRSVGILWYGYPADLPAQKRKPVDQILTVVP